MKPLQDLFQWVEAFPSSTAFRESVYVYPATLTTHIVSMCLFAGLIMMMDLRLLGIGHTRTPLSHVQRRLFPWQMVGFTVSALSGLILVYGQPMRFYNNIFFWMIAVIQAFHLVVLAVFAGAILIVDLRLMGRALTERPVAEVAKDAQPWMIAGLLALTITGVPQMMSNAIREYYSNFFWFKMVMLLLATIYTFTLRRRVTMAAEGGVGPGQLKLVGFLSILLWASVAIPARLIGLFS
jgi:hypothetical protein